MSEYFCFFPVKEKFMDHKDLAQRILRDIGGEDNIVAAAHCATRLRLVLKPDFHNFV